MNSNSTLKKARVQMLIVPIGQNKTMRVSIASKQSQSGLASNDRLLVWVDGQRFGYISKFQQSDDPANIDLTKCKVILPVKHLIGDPAIDSNSFSIKFYVLQGTKKVNKSWVFKMQSEDLAKKWVKFIKDQRQYASTKRNLSASRTPNVPQSPLSKDNLQKKLTPSNKNLQKSQADQSKILKSQVSKDFIKQKSTAQVQNKQYQNQLYETQNKFILDSNSKSPQQQQNINRKLDYQNQKPVDRQKLIEEIRKQQQAKLKRQKQQLLRKQKQLYEKQQKIKLSQRKIEESYKKMRQEEQIKKTNNQQPNPPPIKKYERQPTPKNISKQPMKNINKQPTYTQNNGKQQIVLNEGFFNQDRTPQQKPVVVNSPVNPQQGSKNKPKLDGVNYSQIVNNVIFSKNVPPSPKVAIKKQKQPNNQNKKLEQYHDYLLQLQKLKIQQQKQQQNKQKQHQKTRNKQNITKQNKLPIQLGWTFRYLIKQQQGTQFEIIKQFSQFCANIFKQVISQFHLPQRKRKFLPKYRRQQYFLYQKDDVQFKIAFIGLRQVFNKDEPDNRDRICDQRVVKQFEQQYKNYHTLFKASRQILTRSVKVPLTCLCQYQGFIAFFKVRSQIDNQTGPANLNDKRLQLDLQNISEKTKISLTRLKNKQNVLLLKLNYAFYRQVAVQTGKNHQNFDYYMVQQIKNLMPSDTIFSKHPIKQSTVSKQQKVEYPYFVRQQILTNFDQPRQNINQNILNSLKKSINYRQIKNPNKQPNKSQQQKISQNILQSITIFIKQLNNLNFYFIHPKQLSDQLHKNGINIRYLGLIYDNCTIPILKYYLMSQMAVRSTKALLRKTIQDIRLKQLQLQSQSQIQNISYIDLKLQIIDFLNCILGSTIQTQTIWKFLSVHNLNYFNIPISIQQIQKGYFIISLIHHCNLQIDWNKIIINQAFITNQFFTQDNLIDIKVKTKYYQPILNNIQKDIINKMQQQIDPNIFKILQQKYQIQNKSLPDKFKHYKYFDIFRKYCSNFIAPDFGIHRGYKLLNLYTNNNNNNNNIPNKNQFYIKFMQLKWYLKRQKKQKYIMSFTQLNSQITNNYGDFHPLLSQLYDIMCIYHRNNAQFQDAITFAKSSVINMLKICGTTHPRVGQCYYQMSLCCIKGNKKQQAIISLQKAKSIFQFNQQQNQISYAYVCLKLGLLFLSQQKIQQTQKIIKFALNLFNRHAAQMSQQNRQQNYQQQKIQCYQILSRCYQLDQLTTLQNQLSLQCQKQIRYINNPNNLQKMLKIVLYPILSTLNHNNASIYLDIIAQLPLQINVNTYMKGCQRIRDRIQQNSIVDSLYKYTENIKSIDGFIKENNSLEEWAGLDQVYERETVNDFLALTEQLIYFLGEGFVTGSIRDSL